MSKQVFLDDLSVNGIPILFFLTLISLVVYKASQPDRRPKPPVTTQVKEPSIQKPPIMHCHFHPGQRRGYHWSCCGAHVSGDPCYHVEQHTVAVYDPRVFEMHWLSHPTPATRLDTHHAVVAIDCEMGTSQNNDTELIRVTLIDYFTGETLLDSLVYPSLAMKHYNTKYSGVGMAQMERARKRGDVIHGRDEARKMVWRYVGQDTIVVGHSAQNDLNALRWIHPAGKIVDTYLVEAERRKSKRQEMEGLAKLKSLEQSGEKSLEKTRKKGQGDGELSLKTLAKKRLGRDIQNRGRLGHDSLEDALAAAHLAHWNVVNVLWRD